VTSIAACIPRSCLGELLLTRCLYNWVYLLLYGGIWVRCVRWTCVLICGVVDLSQNIGHAGVISQSNFLCAKLAWTTTAYLAPGVMRSLYRSQFTRADSGLRSIITLPTQYWCNPEVHQQAADKRHTRILLELYTYTSSQ